MTASRPKPKITKYIHKYTSTQCWVSDKELIYILLLLFLFLLEKKEKVAQVAHGLFCLQSLEIFLKVYETL